MSVTPVRQIRRWTAIVCVVVCAHVLVSLVFPRSFGLTAFGDLTQCLLLLLGTLSILSNITTRDKKKQRFWALMAFGCGIWLCAQ
ncbi:MAG: hypothetical protein WB510_16105, partial [Candidatus Sulfotelmatobacter sp.]